VRTVTTAVVCLALLGTATATASTSHRRPSTYPTSVPRSWHAPSPWINQALCIHSREGAWNAATGNGYEGGMQFLRSTWTRVGGPTYGYHWASVASPREQLYRAWLVYRQDGNSWREWGTAGRCGLR